MLNSIQITNFRKHTDTKLDFGDGLSAVRGANEAGKTTITEAIAYALFGVKAIRTPLEDAVTYGCATNTLKVVLVLSLDGVTYTVSRGKPGAQVDYAGGTVTGQTEVTNFMAAKLKVDATSAAKLMMAAQTEIRGALEAGPRATTELIERLSEFDQLDHLVELMQEKLPLGNTSAAQAAVESATERLARAAEVVEPDLGVLESAVESSEAAVASARKSSDAAQADLSAAQTTYADQQAAERERAGTESDLQRRIVALDLAKVELQSVLASPRPMPENADERIESAMRGKAELQDLTKLRRLYSAVKPLCGKQDLAYFEGPANALEARIDELRRSEFNTAKEGSAHKVAVAKLQGQLNLDTCSFCGKDFSELPEVQAKNAATNAEIAKHQTDLSNLEEKCRVDSAELARLEGIRRSAAPYTKALQEAGEHVNADTLVTPPILEWVTKVPPAGDAEPDYDAEIAGIRRQVREAQEWNQSVVSWEGKTKTLGEFVEDLTKRLEGMPVVDSAAAAEALATAKVKLATAREAFESSQSALATAKAALKDECKAWERACAERESAQSALVTAKDTLKQMDFNNALLKKVRGARPVIADKLWNLVLAAVSSYFSEMRGVKSRVSKDADGFKVDDHPVATLSGSTLDILGLAIRVALVRTFLPAAPFLILDEPMAGCDQQRTESMLGFLQSVGFKQVVLITHEDVSESVADHIINIGEQ